MVTKKELEFLKESNAIEGDFDKDSLRQAAYAWEFLKEQEELNIDVILRIHKILMLHQNLMPNQKGYFRNCQVWIGGRQGIDWQRIPAAMGEWCLDAMTSIKVPGKFGSNIKLDHIEFEKIHPFVDGNGRTGRILMLWQRVRAGLPIRIIKANDRGLYYNWFKDKNE